MKKRIFTIIIIAIVSIAALIFYLNKFILPIKIKNLIIKNMETQLNRKVTLEGININFFKGIVLDNLIIYEDPKISPEPFLKIRQISFNVIYLPSFKEGKIIIPFLKIDSPDFNIIRLQDNNWNFSSIIKQKAKSKVPFLFYKMKIQNAKAIFLDKTQTPNFSKQITDINIQANFQLPSKIKFALDGNIDSKLTPIQISSRGDLDIFKKSIHCGTQLNNIDLTEFLPYYPSQDFILKSGKIKNINLNLSFENYEIKTQSRIITENLLIVRDTNEFSGNPIINLDFNFNPYGREILSYKVALDLNNANFSGLAYVNKLENLNGIVNLTGQEIQAKDITCLIQNIPATLSGKVENFNNPQLSLKIYSDTDIERLKNIFKDIFKTLPFDITGKTKLELEISLALRNINSLDFKGKAAISNTTIKIPQISDSINSIFGELEFNRQNLYWNNINANYQNMDYILNGKLNNFMQPTIETELTSKLISLKTKFNFGKDTINISYLNGKALNSVFECKGNIDLTYKENPLVSLALKSQLDLKDLKDILPKFKDSLEKLKPEGNIDSLINLTGQIKNWRNWQLKINAQSPLISIAGFKLNEVVLNYSQGEMLVNNLSVIAKSYDGLINLTGSLNLSTENLPFLINANLTNIDLSKLKIDTQLKDKNLAGLLTLTATLNGFAQDVSSIKGNGLIYIKEGNLWELNLLKGLGKLIYLPDFEKIVVREASGDFLIEDKNIYTEDLILKSEQLNLSCKGKIDFAGRLDGWINIEFSDEAIENSADLRKYLTSPFGQVSRFLGFRLTGTIEKPEYKPQLTIPKEIFAPLKELLDIF